MTTDDFDQEPSSKSQRKRDMQALKDMATKLTTLPADQFSRLDPAIAEAVDDARKIHRGSARRRQIQFIAKLLSRTDTQPIQDIIDSVDASSATYVARFHKLESWRERLVDEEPDAMQEVLTEFPDTDRQQFRALIRQAVAERKAGEQNRHFRRLFQFLKRLEDQQQQD
jgi:ribosome-associated protein